MFGKKQTPEENALTQQDRLKEQADDAPIAAGAELVEKNIYRVPAVSFFGRHTTINTKTAKNLDQILAFWQQCREDGTLETLKTLAHADAVGLTAACTDFKGREYEYWIAVEPAEGASIPEGFERLETVERRCAVFTCEGPAHDAVAQKWHFIYNKWFPKSNYSYDLGPEIENYPFGDMNAADYKCELFVPVKPMELVEAPKRKNSMMSILFVAVGAVLGMIAAGASDKAFIFILAGGLLGYFVFSYVDKRRDEIKQKKENDTQGKK